MTFIDTTKTTLPYTRAWDLDGDGKFTDSEQATPSKAFDTPGRPRGLAARPPDRHEHAGEHRAQDALGEGRAHAHALARRSPPLRSTRRRSTCRPARIAVQCGPWARPRSVSAHRPARQAQDVRRERAEDGNGQIVRYQWDLDGNGVYDVDTGANPKLTTTYKDEAPAVLKPAVTDDDGAPT